VRLAVLAALLLTLSTFAFANGRAACRMVYGPPLWGVCYAEQVIWSADPLEVALGVEGRTWPEGAVSAYTLLGLYMPGWWATLELGRTTSAWRWAIGAGVRW
jgi:hypothetical protein